MREKSNTIRPTVANNGQVQSIRGVALFKIILTEFFAACKRKCIVDKNSTGYMRSSLANKLQNEEKLVYDRLPNLSTTAAGGVTSMADSNNIDGIASARDNVKSNFSSEKSITQAADNDNISAAKTFGGCNHCLRRLHDCGRRVIVKARRTVL